VGEKLVRDNARCSGAGVGATLVTAGSGGPSRGSAAANVLGRLAVACLVALPAVMAVAHRSSPLLLACAAAFALAATLLEQGPRDLARRLAGGLSGPFGVTILAFIAWGAASIAWSPFHALSLFAWGEFTLALVSAAIAALFLPGCFDRLSVTCLAASMILAAAIVFGDLASGMALRHMLGMRAAPFVLNRPALTLLVLLPVALLLFWRERRLWLAALVAVAVAAAILKSESGAAKLGLVALVLAGSATLVWRRGGVVLAGLALLVALALAPVCGELAARFLPGSVYRALAAAHAQERVDIWRSFGAALRDRPILGAGFGAGARLNEAPVAASLHPDEAFLLGVGHPHNAALQIWVELGAIGAFLAALVAALVLRAMQSLDRAQSAAIASLIAAALADSLVGQGAWQGWWPAGIGAALVWFRYDCNRNKVSHGTA
jgi:O-antigen ligase